MNSDPTKVEKSETKDTSRPASMTSSVRDINQEPTYSFQPDQVDINSLSRLASRVASEQRSAASIQADGDGAVHDSTDETYADDNKNLTIEKDPDEVVFDGLDDKENIKASMSFWQKWVIVFVLCFVSATVTMLSSAWSYSAPHITKQFHVGREVGTLGISLIMFGLGIGPMLLSPLSEFYGRKPVFVGGLALSCCFQFLTAFSPNLGGILFGRFMSGFFGSAFLSVVNGTFTDIFEKHEISFPIAIFGVAPFVGPSIGPLLSAGINQHLFWRWVFYIVLMLHGVALALLIFFVPETYAPVLLVKKAKRLRNQTNNDRLYAALEKDQRSVAMTLLKAPKRPFLLLFKDPMIAILCFYSGLILAIVYLFFVAFPYVFKTVFGFDNISQGLAFIGTLVGLCFGAATAPSFQNMYNKIVEKNGVGYPEDRLYPLMIASIILPVGMFIFAWTSYSHVHWIGPVIGTAIYGYGCSLAFTGIIGYTADGYKLYSASAMACNSLVRSCMSGGFPLFGLQMYEKMGVNWASCFLGFLLILMIPFPFAFFKYGKILRSKSPYAWSMD